MEGNLERQSWNGTADVGFGWANLKYITDEIPTTQRRRRQTGGRES